MALSPEMTSLNGYLNINKRRGMTSMDVLRRLKRLTGQRKIGHGGTLDPDAEGVLPVALGRATKFLEYVVGHHKAYTMGVRLGVATDTYDAAGEVTCRRDPSRIRREDVEDALGRFRGQIAQVPPMYSALKRSGTPLYKLARRGIEVEREAREVEVFSIKMVCWSPPELTIEVECGRGFYARSLAHDLGGALDNGAHLVSLVRTRVGPFLLQDATSLEELEHAEKLGNWREALLPIDFPLGHLRRVVVDELAVERIRHGQAVRASERVSPAPPPAPGELACLCAKDGGMVAMARFDPSGPWWKPEKVVSPA